LGLGGVPASLNFGILSLIISLLLPLLLWMLVQINLRIYSLIAWSLLLHSLTQIMLS
jgi:hypothetical protein